MSTEQSTPEGAQGDLATENKKLRAILTIAQAAVDNLGERHDALAVENELLRASIEAAKFAFGEVCFWTNDADKAYQIARAARAALPHP